MALAVNFSIVSGWFPTVVVVVAIASVVLAVGWWDGAWKAQLLIGIPVSLVLTVLVGVAIHVFNLVPDAFPDTFYIWAWLLLFSLVVAVMGWRKAHWSLRTFSVFAVIFTFIAAFTVVNQSYGYYPTLARLFGKNAANFVALPELNAIRNQVRKTGRLPDHGDTISIHIPPTVSRFQTADAYIYVPPAYFRNPEPSLPVIELIAGVPGQSSDWTRAGFADTTATAFAERHGGVSPILVMPDANGPAGDTECVNSKLGNAETYLTVDVPAFMRAEFNAATGPNSLAVAGLSAGGTCSVVLALRNPTVFQTFGDYSGYATQTYMNDDEQGTIQTLFNGSTAAYNAHDPTHLLKANTYAKTSGWFEAGEQDPGALAAAQALHPLAVSAGFEQACLLTPDGTHSFTFWAMAFRDSLPWLSWKLGLTPAPRDSPAKCTPPIP
jgi:enterochelin esterase-like enzyme